MSKKLQITIQDVARLAGVSPASVSKVFNNSKRVSQATRTAVFQAAAELHYRPNNAARSLRASMSHTIGIVTDDIEGLFTTTLVRGIEDALRPHSMHAFLTNSYGEPDLEKEHIEALFAKQVDGLILMSGYRAQGRPAPALPYENFPLVFLYQYPTDSDLPSVMPDDAQGAALGVEHLIAHGHRRIGVINGPEDFHATTIRIQAIERALVEHGLSLPPELNQRGEWSLISGYQQTARLFEAPQPPTAIFCLSDLLALGAVQYLVEHDLRVPEDVSLIGFDNRFFARTFRPPLTTLALPLYDMGLMAGNLLLEAIQGAPPQPGQRLAACQLIERESVAPARD